VHGNCPVQVHKLFTYCFYLLRYGLTKDSRHGRVSVKVRARSQITDMVANPNLEIHTYTSTSTGSSARVRENMKSMA